MACHGSDNTVELFLVCSDEEVKKRLQKKAKKKRKNKQGIAETTEEIATDEPATLQVWPVAIVIDFFTFRSLDSRDPPFSVVWEAVEQARSGVVKGRCLQPLKKPATYCSRPIKYDFFTVSGSTLLRENVFI